MQVSFIWHRTVLLLSMLSPSLVLLSMLSPSLVLLSMLCPSLVLLSLPHPHQTCIAQSMLVIDGFAAASDIQSEAMALLSSKRAEKAGAQGGAAPVI